MKKLIKSILNLIVDWLFGKEKKSSSNERAVRQIGNDKKVKNKLRDHISDYIDNADDGINRDSHDGVQ